MNETLARKLENLPSEPGVYLFRDGAGGLLYVGKAKSLRSRVRSYFGQGSDRRLATWFIDRKVEDLEFLVTRSEKEALLLENNLIKKLKPRYNLRLRDDKTFLHLRIDPRDEYPRIVPTRRIKKDGARYFGPYANAGALRRTLRFLRSFVPLRDCKDSDFRSRTRPCLEFEIGRCSAPCVGLISREAYAGDVERAVRILKGQTRELVTTVKDEMREAAERLQFERAAVLRDYLKSLEMSLERQEVESRTLGDVDAVGVWREGGLTEIVVLFARQGKIVNTVGFTFEHDLPDDELLSEFLPQFYGGGRPIPEEVLVPSPPYGRETLEEWLSERREAACALRVPTTGEKARFLELARENARLTLLASTDKRERTAAVLEELKDRLGLSRAPLRIECFDVSTTGGRDTVASCVEVRDGEPRKTGYRHYRIKDADPGDEYASMGEVLSRRYRKAKEERDLPDLVVVDGGKGQWNVARRVLDELGIEGVDLVSLAKGDRRGRGLLLDAGEEERVFTRGEGDPVVLDQASAPMHLLQRVRDEAHRFAITYHRKRRGARSLASELDAIPLVGPRRKQILLARFGDLDGVRRATEEELAAVDGIGPRAAREIRRHFGGAGR
ncbi:MAG: excinuclease ABC subunit UvrC [Planctomycetota bacterium JB042]